MAPAVPALLALALAFLLVCVALALAAARDPRRIGEAALITAAAVFLAAHWLYSASGQVAVFGLVLFVLGAALNRGLSGLPPVSPPIARTRGGVATASAGLLVIAVATALKLVELGEWPAHLNAYSAETGWWGILTLEGVWPDDFFRGVEYDLVNGGRSPLHLPLTWTTVRLAGGTVYAVRLAEVLASTALLLVLWGWLRWRLATPWSVVALAVFALSPWHLAQSRMGTFFSASVAVGIAMLWAADRLAATEGAAGGAPAPLPAARRLGLWAALGCCAGLVGYAYAPLKVLYLFFVVVWLRLSWAASRHRRPGWWQGPIAAALPFVFIFAVQLGVPPRFDEMFRRDFGPLATDTSIWHKTPDGVVTAEAQPATVVAANAWDNLVEWWRRTWSEQRILVWYAPALAVAVPGAALLAFRSATWVPAIYFLIGVVPPLIIYPVQRRTLVLWPLVYVAGVVAARGVAALCARLVHRAWWRWTTRGAFAAFAVIASLHGLKVYATTNSIVGTGTYFGPDHRLAMLLEAERLLPVCRVYFVNATLEEKLVASVRLFEAARRAGGSDRVGFVEFQLGDPSPAVPRNQPACFLLLARPPEDAESRQAFVPAETLMRDLGDTLPGSIVMQRWAADGSDTLQYVVVTAAATEPEARGDADEETP